MGEVVSNAKLYVNGGNGIGNLQLQRVEDFNIDSEQDGDLVTAVGVKGAAGARFKEGGGEISLTVFIEQGTPEVAWQKHKVLRTRFTFTVQWEGGERYAFLRCFVANVSIKGDSQASHMYTVKLKYGDVKPLPTAP
jgi:hypothetical protein